MLQWLKYVKYVIKGFMINESMKKAKIRYGEENMEDIAYTYIVECADGTFYTGWTKHLDQRVKRHNEGTGAKYTRSRRPVHLVYYETFASRQEAMKRESAIKKLTRKDKLKLIGTASVTRDERHK